MNNTNKSDEQEDTGRRGNQVASSELIAGSPSSHSNSSSSRRQRVVDIIQEQHDNNDDNQSDNWMIRAEFYDEDVALNSDHLSMSDEGETDEGGEDEEREPGDILSNVDDFDILASDDYDDDDEENDFDYDDEDMDPEAVGIGDFDMLGVEDDDRSSISADSDGDHDSTANYDTTLPVSHPYLGDNLEESRGREVLVEGSTVSMALFNLKNVVLLPGQVVPITSKNLNFRISMYLKTCIHRSSTTIGLLSEPHKNSIGTTAEIRNYSMQDDEIRMILEGRQRFKSLTSPFETVKMGPVRILPEISLGHPYPHISSLSRFYSNLNTPSKFIISKHPHWLLKRYEGKSLMKRILDQIKAWCNADLTKDENEFSYWVAANLPISDSDRIKALGFSCAEARLLWLLEILEGCEHFGCSACMNMICHKKDVFPMSLSGPQCSFVNSGGFIHDTLTVSTVVGLIPEYTWSTEFSWFPGYAWRQMHCNNCSRHIGWCYKSVAADTKPKRFYGLSRVNVRLLRTHDV